MNHTAISFDTIKQNEEVTAYMTAGDHVLEAMGYTEHAFVHGNIVANWASEIISAFGYRDREAELVKIAAYLHDIGNVVNREGHAQSSAIMTFTLLTRLGMDPKEISQIISSIGNHDEGNGQIISPLSAALAIADKSDVRRSRVRNQDPITFDIHDRVNYAVEKSELIVDATKKTITLYLTIDTAIAPKIEYFEIFLGRMMMCRKAADYLGATFLLFMNQTQML